MTTTPGAASGPRAGVGDARATLDAVEAALDAVQAALARLDEGRYFACVRCGRALDRSTPDADPLIDHCVDPCVER